MESYLQRFMTLGRDQPLAAEKVSLATVVEDALSLVRPACVHAGIDLELIRPSQPLCVRGDAEALRQLTVNLITNAVEAAGRQSNGRAKIFVALESVHVSSALPLGEGQVVRAAAPQSQIHHEHPGHRPHPSPLPEGEGTGRSFATLTVRDNGPGPSPEVAQRMFEPFVSGKPEGTGLGLYVARQVVEGHHGSIRWQRENDATCFTVELPLMPEAC